MRGFFLRVMIGCLVLSLGSISLFSQAAQPEVSLDDNPNAPNMGPWVPPFLSAEDEFGLGLPASLAGFIGPSPTLNAVTGFFDSDVLVPGPALLITFPPPPYYVDSISCDHSSMVPCGGGLFVRFSVDRATGGVTAADASFNQAALNEQPADIFRTDRPYTHVGNFVPLPVPVPFACFAGVLPTAGTGAGAGAFNQLMYDHWGTFGFLPAPPCPVIGPGTHDNIDGFNEWPHSMLAPPNPNNFFTLHPASAALNGFLPGDIFITPNPPGLGWPAAIFATAAQCGLDCIGGPGTDSIDGLAVWDNGKPGVMEPGIDYAAFSLAPGSASLGVPTPLGGVLNAADILVTDFRGFFYIWLIAGDLGVGPNPSPPLPGVCGCQINVDALDLTIDPEPVPYINPSTNPVTDPGTKR